ncbi:MAG: hypothetical protein U0133_10205 [Gemmatimonadales bacterium]
MSDLDDLDRTLRGVRFEPRASLEAEIRGRAAHGELPPTPARPVTRRLLAAAAVVLVAAGFGGWQLLGPHAVTVDHCCQDLDGGGTADDGVLILSRAGSSVQGLRIYEDRDQSGGFSPGDEIRFLRGSNPAVTGSVNGLETREFCCLDYDGGGPSDDALVVMGRAPDRITMAAIYERRSTGGSVQLR